MDNNIKGNEQEIVNLKNQLGETNKKLQNSTNEIKFLQKEIIKYKNNLDRFQKVVDCLDTNVYWKDEKGTYLGCNKKIAELSNVKSINDVIGKTDYDLSPKEVADELRENDKLAMTTRTSVNKEERLILQSGEVIELLAKKSALIDSNGDVKGIIGVSIDISDRKKLENEIKNKNEELKKKDQIKTEFIENFSHDVKVPINALVGRTQLLKLISAKDKNEKLAKLAKDVEDSSMMLNTLFAQMRDIVIHEQFDNKLYNTTFNLSSLIEKEIEIAKASVPNHKNINIDFHSKEDLSFKVDTDHYKLSQIIRNLLSNAIKFTDEGNVSIKTEIIRNKDNQVSFKLIVADTGIGINEAYQNNIFELFNRANITSHNNNRHGMGLGLYIVKNNLNILGGSIGFESHLGQGSKFFVDIPLKTV